MNGAKSKTSLIILGLLLAIFIFLSTAAMAVIFFQHRELTRLRAGAQPAPLPSAQALESLAGISEDSVPGQYHWIEDGNEIGVIILNPDHSVISTTGAKNVRFRWTLQSEGLLVTWGNPYVLFTQSTAPGHYVGSVQGKVRQMEKLP